MKKFAAIIITLAMLLALASCGTKTETETTTAEETTEEITEATETSAETTVAADEVKEDSTAPEESTSEAVTDKKDDETKSSEKEESTTKLAAPSTKAEIIAVYNDAVNNAYNKKAGFKKNRYTDNAQFDMSLALKAFKSLVEKFVGIGDENKYSETVTKGKWDEDTKRYYLRKSTLTENEVESATVKEDGKYYIVTLNIVEGNSIGNKDTQTTSAPLDRCGICVGNEDKNYYDHKTAEVIYDAIAGTYEGASIKESYSNAKAVAKINAETGELVSLTVTFDITVGIDISIGSGTASGTTHVQYSDFKY